MTSLRKISTEATDQNPLGFLMPKRSSKKRKNKILKDPPTGLPFRRSFSNRSTSSLGFRAPSKSYTGFLSDSHSRSSLWMHGESSQSQGSFPMDPAAAPLSHPTNSPPSSQAVASSPDDGEEEPLKPIILDEKCMEIQRLMNKRDWLVFRERDLPQNEDMAKKRKILQFLPQENIGSQMSKRFHQRVVNSFYQLLHFPSLFSLYSDHYGVLVRHSGRGILQVEGLQNTHNFPLFLNSAVLEIQDEIETLEYLPIKRTLLIEPADVNLAPLNREEAYIGAVWDRLQREFILIRAEREIQSLDMEECMGYIQPGISSGEKMWVPLFMARKLCSEGLVNVDIPTWLQFESLQRIKNEEVSTRHHLIALPFPYFFEMAYLFGLFGVRPTSFFSGRINFNGSSRSYISKARGLIEKIKQIRESKIVDIMGKILEETVNAFLLPEIQLFETYIVSEILSVVWDKEWDYENTVSYPKLSLSVLYEDTRTD
ncbi:hypothetical protein IE077_000627 [Cardiosporidium cionae]|uniref:Uncharacterized protein n=1 Tax=Cardiosporidium cionae TaxID=476202 RepID=A0ABQ7J7A0_9APIC|nr:hypothetical protein IE077_000627 [Cardiosporidium cionae]|eukprot:KAF8819870.1 hypothetical protein IE077_000627 [Cardiosporidium cionae]